MNHKLLTPLTYVLLSLSLVYHSSAQRCSWFKGNTHTHTWNSTGDASPDDVVKWYRRHGYSFIFITDQGLITNVEPLNALFAVPGQFVVLRGEEVTSNRSDIHVHVNALNPSSEVHGVFGVSPHDTLQKDIDLVNSVGGLAQINHPNFLWQLTAEDIMSIKGSRLLEIMNMHPLVNSAGAGRDFPSVEEVWDQVLSMGIPVWGVASDDMHQLKESEGEESGGGELPSLPGRGWIVVRAQHLTVEDIVNSIANGDFYSSTGVELADYKVSGGEIILSVKQNERYRTKYRIQFVGKEGRILQDGTANPAIYKIKGDELYVRARITDSNGFRAWTQPVFVHAPDK